MAALAGLVVLGQHLAAHEWLGIAVVVLANAAAVAGPREGAGRAPALAYSGRDPSARAEDRE